MSRLSPSKVAVPTFFQIRGETVVQASRRCFAQIVRADFQAPVQDHLETAREFCFSLGGLLALQIIGGKLIVSLVRRLQKPDHRAVGRAPAQRIFRQRLWLGRLWRLRDGPWRRAAGKERQRTPGCSKGAGRLNNDVQRFS